MLTIATWNVNSVRARLERVTNWLHEHQPDLLCLQEIKATEDTFPWEPIQALGYDVTVHGQPTYNGVALVHRSAAIDVERGLDNEARVIAATIERIRVINVYVPNGQKVGSAKHQYKLQWLDKLHAFVAAQIDEYQDLLLAGDLNVAPADIDAAHPEMWSDSVLCDPLAREKLAGIAGLGLTDVLRNHLPGPGVYTWWDYRTSGFDWNDGLRIDHILATPGLASRAVSAWVDVAERGADQPSDHAPVLVRMTTEEEQQP